VFRKIIFAVFLAIALVGVSQFALQRWADARLGELEVRWRDDLFQGSEPATAFPPRGTNDAANRVESLAAALGIDFRPEPAEGDRGADGSADGSARGSSAFLSEGDPYLLARATSGDDGVVDLPPDLRGSLLSHREVLDALVVELQETPEWSLDLERGLEMPIVDYRAHIELHKFLVLGAWEALERGDHATAERRLDAASRLREGSGSDPLLIAKSVNSVEIARELALLRRLCPQTVDWVERLRTVDLPGEFAKGLRTEAWLIVHSIDRPETFAELGWVAPYLGRPLARALIAPYAAVADEAARDLVGESWSRFDAVAFYTERLERIPSWNPISRVALANAYDGWGRAGRAQVGVELTKQVLELRALENSPSSLTPSAVDPRLEWRAAREDPLIEIALFEVDGGRYAPTPSGDDSASSVEALALRHVVDLSQCASK